MFVCLSSISQQFGLLSEGCLYPLEEWAKSLWLLLQLGLEPKEQAMNLTENEQVMNFIENEQVFYNEV